MGTTLNNTTQQIIQSNKLTIENEPVTTAQPYISTLKETPTSLLRQPATDNKPSPIEPNNKTNAEKYKNSTPTKQSQLSDSKDNTPLTTQNTLKNRTQLMLNKQGKPNNNTKIGEQGQDGTAPVLSNARVAKADLKAKKAQVKSAKAKAAKAKAAAKAKIAPKKVYRKVKVATKSPAEPKKKGQRSRQSLRQKVKAAKKDGDENDKDNKPSPIEPNNKKNAEKYKNSTPTKQSQLSDSKDNTPLTTQNTLKNRTQLMLNKQGKPNNNTKIGEQGQDGTAPVLSNAKSAKAELKAKKAQVKSAKAKAAKAKAAAK